MISVEFRKGISETLGILKHMEDVYIKKIPKKFISFLEENKDPEYIPQFDYSKEIKEMPIKEKTKDILATIYINYWCTPQEKEDYRKILKQNEQKHQEELRKKYNPDFIFKTKRK